MTFPFRIHLELSVLKIALVLSLAGIFLCLSIHFITALFEGYFLKFFSDWNYIRVSLPTLMTLAMIVLPIFVGSFIRPTGHSKFSLFVHGLIVLGLSSIVYFALLTYFPRLSLYPYDELSLGGKSVATLCLLTFNLIIYLPKLFKAEAKS